MFTAEHKDHYNKTIKLAIPVCLSNLGHVMVGVVDTAMIGYIGSVEQAGVALANSFFFLVLVFGIGVSNGVTPLVAAADGEGNKVRISELLKNCLGVNIGMGIFLFCLLISISPLMLYLQQDERVVNVAAPFLNVMGFSMIPLSLFFALKQFTEGLSFTLMSMVVSITGNLLNVLLNYILIFGHWGFEPMGVMGSCWASFFSRLVMAIMMLIYFMLSKNFAVYRANFKLNKTSLTISKKIMKIGVPSGLQGVFEVGAFGFAVIMIGWLGPMQQAAHQIAISIASCTFMIASGLAAAASVRVGNYNGALNYKQLRMAGFTALFIGFLFMIFTAICLTVFNQLLPPLFSYDENVIEMAAGLLLIAALFQLADGTQVIALGVLRGVEDVTMPTIITLLAYWIIGLPCSYFLGFVLHFGISGVWFGLTLSLFIVSAFSILRFNSITKRTTSN